MLGRHRRGPASRERSQRSGSAQKPVAAGAPPYSILVNRRAGRFVAAAAYRAGLSPNQVTAVSATFTFGGIILPATTAPAGWVGALVWAALALGYIFDSADGQLARLQGSGSVAGEWLDHVVDSTKIVSLHLAVLIAASAISSFPRMDRSWFRLATPSSEPCRSLR